MSFLSRLPHDETATFSVHVPCRSLTTALWKVKFPPVVWLDWDSQRVEEQGKHDDRSYSVPPLPLLDPYTQTRTRPKARIQIAIQMNAATSQVPLTASISVGMLKGSKLRFMALQLALLGGNGNMASDFRARLESGNTRATRLPTSKMVSFLNGHMGRHWFHL